MATENDDSQSMNGILSNISRDVWTPAGIFLR